MRNRKNLLPKVAVAGVCAAFLVGAAILAYFFFLSRPGNDSKAGEGCPVLFSIEPGSGAAKVAEDLAGQGLIRNPALFRIVMRLSGTDRKLKAGTYFIDRVSTMYEIASRLKKGEVATVSVTLSEGLTARMMAAKLEEAGICGAREFLDAVSDPEIARDLGLKASSLEGYLFPDTYKFALGISGSEAAKTMAGRFFEILDSMGDTAPQDRFDLHRKVILASIVEREYRVTSEAGLIAGVFANRLSIGMPLQSCATVVYVITERQGKQHPDTVYYRDLKIEDPYNTYLHKGLPPGPISNPGATALRAAFAPEKSPYLYFRLADSAAGTHRFSVSFDEHVEETIPVKGW